MHQDVDGHATAGAERRDHPEGVVGREAEDVLALADDDEGLEEQAYSTHVGYFIRQRMNLSWD